MRTWRWHVVRFEMAAAIAAVAVLPFLLVAPNTMGPSRDPLESWITWVGLAGLAIGIAVMIRIYRADPERAPSSWRAIRR